MCIAFSENRSIIIIMKKGIEHHFAFWFFVWVMYALSIALSFERVYISQDFPVFYTEEEIPDPLSPVSAFISFFTPR